MMPPHVVFLNAPLALRSGTNKSEPRVGCLTLQYTSWQVGRFPQPLSPVVALSQGDASCTNGCLQSGGLERCFKAIPGCASRIPLSLIIFLIDFRCLSLSQLKTMVGIATPGDDPTMYIDQLTHSDVGSLYLSRWLLISGARRSNVDRAGPIASQQVLPPIVVT